jgi:hypothetical protein
MSAGSGPPNNAERGLSPANEPFGSGMSADQPTKSATPVKEPPNPFYALLLICSTAFVVTGLALAVVPWDQLPGWLRKYGWQLVLAEMVLVIVTGLASMALDRWRSLRK